jgi:hypothetical protein
MHSSSLDPGEGLSLYALFRELLLQCGIPHAGHWIARPPPWLHVVPFAAPLTPVLLADLDPGDHDAASARNGNDSQLTYSPVLVHVTCSV